MKKKFQGFLFQDFVWLQHPEGVDPPPGAQTPGRRDRAQPEDPGPEVQLRQDDLPHLLRQAPPQGRQLQEEVMRTLQQPQTQEEAEVSLESPSSRRSVQHPAVWRHTETI